MSLTAGTRLGHYDVTALLGEGGMGQVWQATDTQLNRQVALKILHDAFAADPDRLARFTREAQILASLNHPAVASTLTIVGFSRSERTITREEGHVLWATMPAKHRLEKGGQMRKLLLLLLGSVGLIVASACQEAAPPAPPMDEAPASETSAGDPREQFAGNWALVRVERYGARGELMPPPDPPAFGAGEPLGFIMYDRDGHMGVVIQQDGRQPYAGEQRTPEEALAAMRSYTSYFGPYTVNAEEGYVTHHLLGSLSPNGAGGDNKRFYEFSGNQLFLQPPPGDSGIQLRIVWERVSDLTDLIPEHRQLIGFWQIDSVERRTTDGGSLPANQYADGYIIYMPSGHMAVHLMRPDRPRNAGTPPTPEEADAALGSYASYFGPFTIHADEGYVVHHRIGHTSPSQMGTDAQRFYELTGNHLILKPPVATVEGQQVQSYIRWNRIGDVK